MKNIHPLWLICIITRILVIIVIRNFYKKFNVYLAIILLSMGSHFMYKGFTSSNMEFQIAKVFWHETRYLHGLLHIISAYFVYIKNIRMASLTLLLDIIFSFMYRSSLFF